MLSAWMITYLRDTSCLLPAQLLRFVNEHMGGNSDILCISATISEAEDGIAFLETMLAFGAQFLNRAGEFYTHCCGCLGRERVEAFALEEVHAVEAEGFHFHQGLGAGDVGAGDGVDEHVFDGAFAAFDVFVWEVSWGLFLVIGHIWLTDCSHGRHVDLVGNKMDFAWTEKYLAGFWWFS